MMSEVTRAYRVRYRQQEGALCPTDCQKKMFLIWEHVFKNPSFSGIGGGGWNSSGQCLEGAWPSHFAPTLCCDFLVLRLSVLVLRS